MPVEHTGYSILAFVLERLGTTPILLFLTVNLIGPWVVIVWHNWKQDKRMSKVFERQDTRFEAVVKMYEDNVALVKNYESISRDLREMVIVTTQTMQKMVDRIDTNNYCPLVRQAIKPIIEEDRG